MTWLELKLTGESLSAGRPPNFVVLFADDLGYDDWEYGGHPKK